jgi:hypothetical protein
MISDAGRFALITARFSSLAFQPANLGFEFPDQPN